MAAALPAAREPERLALGLVVLARRPRAEVARRLGLDEDGLASTLARARKELRRTLVALPGSGWCERAELLISDRLDGALDGSSAVRLDVHLRNCPRCVEHERRLVQAADALVADVAPPGPPELVPVSEPEKAHPLPTTEERAEHEAAADYEEPEAGEPQAGAPEAGEPEVAEPEAAEPDAPQPARGLRDVAVAVSWHVLLAIAVVLALASLALTVAGVLGADL
jgi:hypothetical protein